jgi:tetratricopeptide (TPR) repeat protein
MTSPPSEFLRIVRETFREYFWDEDRALLVVAGVATLLFGLLYYLGVFHRSVPYLYYGAGRVQEILGGPGDPEASYDEALGQKPAWGEAYYQRGLLLGRKGEMVRALEDLRMAAEFLPRPAKAFRAHGTLVASQGSIEQALWDFQQAYRAEPGDGRTPLARAKVLLEAGRFEEALADFREALRLSPGLVEARIGREEAERAIEQRDLKGKLLGGE